MQYNFPIAFAIATLERVLETFGANITARERRALFEETLRLGLARVSKESCHLELYLGQNGKSLKESAR